MTKDLPNNKIFSQYDYVVVGSGLAALAFIHETLTLDSAAKILCLERGNDDLRGHYGRLLKDAQQGSSKLSLYTDVDPSESSWQVSELTAASQQLNGSAKTCFLLGGRSNYWYGWCMQPEEQHMRHFPLAMVEATRDPRFWTDAVEFLGVRSIDTLNQVFDGGVQDIINKRLTSYKETAAAGIEVLPATFAHGDKAAGVFTRFSVADRLLALRSAALQNGRQCLDIWLDHTALQLDCGQRERHIECVKTNKGILHFPNPKTKFILCAGTIPNAILLLNSFTHLRNSIGSQLSGHFRSHIFAKITSTAFLDRERDYTKRKGWGAAAKVLRGCDEITGLQFHIQLSAFYYPNYKGQYSEIVSEFPRYGTIPPEEHLQDLKDDVLIACTALGELNGDNDEAWLRRTSSDDLSSNVELQITITDSDKQVWDTMDSIAFGAVECLSLTKAAIVYWSKHDRAWAMHRPSKSERRSPILVHEACVTPAGDKTNETAIDDKYRVRGCNNVFVTGAGIFPTAGSWNPTLAVCGFAQHLARVLSGMELSAQ